MKTLSSIACSVLVVVAAAAVSSVAGQWERETDWCNSGMAARVDSALLMTGGSIGPSQNYSSISGTPNWASLGGNYPEGLFIAFSWDHTNAVGDFIVTASYGPYIPGDYAYVFDEYAVADPGEEQIIEVDPSAAELSAQPGLSIHMYSRGGLTADILSWDSSDPTVGLWGCETEYNPEPDIDGVDEEVGEFEAEAWHGLVGAAVFAASFWACSPKGAPSPLDVAKENAARVKASVNKVKNYKLPSFGKKASAPVVPSVPSAPPPVVPGAVAAAAGAVAESV